MATLVLNEDLSGETRFHLYSDSACQSELGSGTQAIDYEVAAEYGDVSVLKVHQHDANDPNNDFIFFLPIKFANNGAYVHIDGELSDSGPYFSLPTENEISDFVSNSEGVEVFFSR